jgi:hypothetical protein
MSRPAIGAPVPPAPMLATAGPLPTSDDFAFEPKWDGARVLSRTAGTTTQLFSRKNWVGRTARCPLGGSFSVRPPAEPDWPVSEHPALQ